MSATQLNDAQEGTAISIAISRASQQSMGLYDRAVYLEVKDQESYDLSVELYKAALELEKAVHAAHDPVCDHWFNLHKQATANRKKDLDRVIEAKKLAKSKGDLWALEQERIRLEEERRRQEEARRQGEEQERLAREAQEAERKRLAAQEEEERLKLAAEAEANGATKGEVNKILETPLDIPEPEPYVPAPVVMPTVAPTFQKSSDLRARWKYTGVMVDLAELVKAAAQNPYLIMYLMADQKEINARARNQQDKFSLPGCRLQKERV